MLDAVTERMMPLENTGWSSCETRDGHELLLNEGLLFVVKDRRDDGWDCWREDGRWENGDHELLADMDSNTDILELLKEVMRAWSADVSSISCKRPLFRKFGSSIPSSQEFSFKLIQSSASEGPPLLSSLNMEFRFPPQFGHVHRVIGCQMPPQCSCRLFDQASFASLMMFP
jgi:hypothetical protein